MTDAEKFLLDISRSLESIAESQRQLVKISLLELEIKGKEISELSKSIAIKD
jgi:hypothetical protein